MWISKDAEERKKELLEAALDIFYQKGYHKTSINDIISRVGVTKGAFYYYFKSMEEVLETIALQEAARLVGIAQGLAENENLNALEKLKGLMKGAIQYHMDNLEYREKYYRLMQAEENAKLALRINTEVYRASFPLLKDIVEQGLQEGIFHTENSEDAAELYLYLTSLYKSRIFTLLVEAEDKTEAKKIAARKLRQLQQQLEAALGLEKGALELEI